MLFDNKIKWNVIFSLVPQQEVHIVNVPCTAAIAIFVHLSKINLLCFTEEKKICKGEEYPEKIPNQVYIDFT